MMWNSSSTSRTPRRPRSVFVVDRLVASAADQVHLLPQVGRHNRPEGWVGGGRRGRFGTAWDVVSDVEPLNCQLHRAAGPEIGPYAGRGSRRARRAQHRRRCAAIPRAGTRSSRRRAVRLHRRHLLRSRSFHSSARTGGEPDTIARSGDSVKVRTKVKFRWTLTLAIGRGCITDDAAAKLQELLGFIVSQINCYNSCYGPAEEPYTRTLARRRRCG